MPNEILTNPSTGLTQKKAKDLLLKNGPNTIKQHKTNFIQLAFEQFRSPLIYLLVFSSLLSLALREILDGIIILIFIFINAVIGFALEFRSNKASQLLSKLLVKKATVIRDSKKILIEVANLVEGDLILLKAGDIVPADAKLIESNGLLVDESILTGESIPIYKTTEKPKTAGKHINIHTINQVFSQTKILEGFAKCLVTNTGERTEFGQIATLTNQAEEDSIFNKEITKLSKFILKLVLITLFGLVFIDIFFRHSAGIAEIIIFSIALAVSVIPEGLPVVTTFSLSIGASRLTKLKVLIKKLTSLKDLGSVTILCTDKTGTLTENKLKLKDVFAQSDRDKDKVIQFAALGGTLIKEEKDSNNSFDLAILDKLSEKSKKILRNAKLISTYPFDPIRKRNSVVIEIGEKSGFTKSSKILIVRGAIEELISHSNSIKDKKLSKSITDWVNLKGINGERTLGIWYKELSNKDDQRIKSEDELTNVKFLGLMSFYDPIKQSAIAAIQKAGELGIQLKILTGDSKEVAACVAFSTKLIDDMANVISGEELEKLSEKKYIDAIFQYHVFARLSPAQKFNIINQLQKTKNVAYLGEGINDAPALKAANIGIVVDDASDIARESADIVLMHRNLMAIIDSVTEGRKTYINTTKYIKATLASNFGNFYAIVISSFFIPYLPMLPIQILLLNLLSDFPMITIATDNVEAEELSKPSKLDFKEFTYLATILGLISTVFDLIFFFVFSRYGEAKLQTAWVVGSIVTELLFIYSIRSSKPIYKSFKPSRMILVLTGLAGICALVLPFSNFGHEVFKLTFLTFNDYKIIAIISVFYLITSEIGKNLFYKFYTNSKHRNSLK